VVNYSNTRPPADAHDAALFLAASESEPHEAVPATRTDSDVTPAADGRKAEYPWDRGRPAYEDDPGGSDDDWHHAQSYPGSIFYSTYPGFYSAYAGRGYSRRHHHRPFKRYRHHYKAPPYRQHLRYYRQRHIFGERRYDRHYYSNPYRYHSSAPRFYNPGPRYRHGDAYKPGHGRKHFGPRPFYRRGPGTFGHGRGYRGSGGHRLRR
jgi:hypothetical protein